MVLHIDRKRGCLYGCMALRLFHPYNKTHMEVSLNNIDETKRFAEMFGRRLKGGEVLELTGDVGSGKTTFTKGLAMGLDIKDDVQSPSFTISRTYDCRDGLTLHHYDFYRLREPGIMQYDLAESVSDPKTITVVEWGETVSGVLPKERFKLHFSVGPSEDQRQVSTSSSDLGLKELYAAWN